jgi:uncharacterized protein (TIGR02217 family)
MPALLSYHNEPFPLSVDRVVATPAGNTTIIKVGLSAHEVRIANWADGQLKFNAAPGVRSLADAQALISFQRRRAYRLFSFPVRDPLDHKVARGVEGTFATGNGTAGPFQLTKTYADASNADVRKITKPQPTTVKIYVAGVLKTEGVHYQLDYLTGLVTFLAGHFPTAGQAIEWEGKFYVPVRFAEDELPLQDFLINFTYDGTENQVSGAAGEISPILLVEDMGA